MSEHRGPLQVINNIYAPWQVSLPSRGLQGTALGALYLVTLLHHHFFIPLESKHGTEGRKQIDNLSTESFHRDSSWHLSTYPWPPAGNFIEGSKLSKKAPSDKLYLRVRWWDSRSEGPTALTCAWPLTCRKHRQRGAHPHILSLESSWSGLGLLR